MAELLLVLGAIAAAVFAAIGWLHAIHLIGAVPSWISATALLLACLLILLSAVTAWRARL